MVKKLTLKSWLGTLWAVLLCAFFGVPMLWKYAPSAIEALSGKVPELAAEETMSNIYGISGLGLFFVLLDLFIIIRQMTNSVGKRVRGYLTEHPGITEEMLDNDFFAAEEMGNVRIGRRWTFSHDLRPVLAENAGIVWVYSETERVKNKINYYLGLGFVNGKTELVKVAEKKLPLIKEHYEKYPHILVGNNPEYGYLFRNSLNEFLDIKYRQNVENPL